MNAIYPLFCYPVMMCKEIYQFSAAEERYIAGLAMAENVGNAMSENDQILDSQELSRLNQFIQSQLAFYTEKILRLKPENKLFITQSWANRALPGQFHPKHKHPNSVLSGVFFVSGTAGDELPPIRFHRQNDLLPLELEFEELNDFNGGVRWFEPVKGLLVVFPSVLEHDVGINETASQRITLSFNTFISGPLGNRAQLTLVDR